MKKEQAEKIIEIFDELGINAKIYQNYSGRGMFNNITHGIVLDDENNKNEIIKSLINHIFEIKEIDVQDLGELRSDSLGLDTIIY